MIILTHIFFGLVCLELEKKVMLFLKQLHFSAFEEDWLMTN